MAIVIIPTPLRKFTNSNTRIPVAADTVATVITELTSSFPELGRHLTDANGKIATFMNIFVGDEDIRNLNNEETEVKEETIISIVPAIAGGS
jgi:molybdopterin converting factor small subunit